MQSYENKSESLGTVNEISGYMLLKLNISQVEMMSKHGLLINDVRYVPMFEEYLSLRRDGAKKKQTMEYLARKYFVGESTVKRVIKRFSRRVTT